MKNKMEGGLVASITCDNMGLYVWKALMGPEVRGVGTRWHAVVCLGLLEEGILSRCLREDLLDPRMFVIW